MTPNPPQPRTLDVVPLIERSLARPVGCPWCSALTSHKVVDTTTGYVLTEACAEHCRTWAADHATSSHVHHPHDFPPEESSSPPPAVPTIET